MTDEVYDIVVIGGGPAGYIGAIRAAQLGLKTACVEKDASLGGCCLNVGCIPSKALLESSKRYHDAKNKLSSHGILMEGVQLDLETMMKRKAKIVGKLAGEISFLFEKYSITRVTGQASLKEPGVVQVKGETETTLRTKNILIATGSTPASLPGIELDFDRIGTSTEALSFDQVPGHLVVIGAGAIGLELGSVWKRLGAQVTVLEYMDRILPGADSEVAGLALQALKKQGLRFRLGSRVTSARVVGDKCFVEYDDTKTLEADRVLVAVGRKPHTEGLGLENVNVGTNERGFIIVDEHFQTSVPGIYAAGDVIGGLLLAHKATHEAVACVERMISGWSHVNYETLPSVVYTEPEVAQVGKTEEELNRTGVPYKKGTFAFRSNGRARAIGETEGIVKILSHEQTDRILGVHIVGPRAGDLIAEAAMGMEFGASAEDITMCWHAHPTLAEVVHEAALDVDERAIHS